MLRFKIKLLLAAVFIFTVVFSCEAASPAPKATDLAIDFKLQDLANNTVTLSSYKDKQPVILFFWTTWCPFCRQELKKLESAYPQLTKEGWELLAIDVGEPAYKVENYLSGHNITFKVLLDKDTEVANTYDILGVPTFVFVNKYGKIIFRDNFFPQGRLKELISE